MNNWICIVEDVVKKYDEDPVCNYIEGPKLIRELYQEAGIQDVNVKMYHSRDIFNLRTTHVTFKSIGNVGVRAFRDICQLQAKPDSIFLWCFSVILFQKLLSVLAGRHILVLFKHLREMRKVTVP